MALARAVVVVGSLGAIACGTLLAIDSADDDPAARPAMDRTGGDGGTLGDRDGDTTTPAGDANAGSPRVLVDGGKLVFVTSTTATAAFDGGAEGANAFCEDVAKSAGITGRAFVAYLHLDGLLGGAYTGSSLSSEKGWFLPNGERAFEPPLIGSVPDVALAIDESGKAIDASAGAWIGSGSLLGLFGGSTCAEWTSSNGSALVGDPSTPPDWRDDDERPCSERRHVYCFER